MVARTAALAAHLKTGATIDFDALRYTGSKEQIQVLRRAPFNNTPWDWACDLRQVNPEVYHYWLESAGLLGMVVE